MPTINSLITTIAHVLMALGLNWLFNTFFSNQGYTVFSVYFVLMAHSYFKFVENVSKLIIIDPVKLAEHEQKAKLRLLKPEK